MIKVTLYNSLPSDTWAFAYRVPWHENIVGLVAGLKTRANAQSAVDYLSRELDTPAEFVA